MRSAAGGQEPLCRVPVPGGPAVLGGSLAILGGLLAILGGLGAVGFGLEPVQGRLLPLCAGGVTTRRSSIAGLDQVGAVTGAEVTVAGTPVPVYLGPAPVERGVRDGDASGRQVT